MNNSRRSFIKISALGAGGVALSSAAFSAIPLNDTINSGVSKIKPLPLRRTATYCEVCFWKCAAWAYSDELGSIQKIIGNQNDPHCFGRLCPRGTGGVGMYSDKDRLKKPLIRTEINGKQEFKEASWKEALNLVAEKMQNIKDQYGPESMALIKHGSPGSHLEHLFKAFGSDTIAEPAYAQCRGPRETGFGLTFGSWVGSPEPTDIRDTKCLVLIGSHLGENMHNSQVQEMSDAIDNGAQIITVDPRFSTVASKSQYWLPIKPSTDIALLLSWMHVLIYEDLYNKEYVEKYGHGFEALKKHVKPFSPEWAYGITTIKPDQIRKTARTMASAAPSTIVHPGRHVTWYGDDSQRARAVAILNGLLGSWGNRGGFYFKEKIKIPKYPHPEYPHPKWGWKEIGEKFPFAEMGNTTEVIKASIASEDQKYPIKGWFVAGTNLVASVPQKNLIEKAAESLDFIVVMDTMPMEITGYADVILPECTYLERYDGLRSSPNREPSVALRAPAVEPLYNTKPAWWMAKELGNRLGLSAYFDYETIEEVLDWQLKQIGSSLEEMKKIGVKNFKRKSGPLYLQKGKPYEFPTQSGKIEFYSDELASLGLDPMPVYTPHETPNRGYYRLNYGRSPMHTFSRTINNPNLSDLTDENTLWVNPKVARIENLKKGQEVWLENQDGKVSQFPIKVRVTERIRWDSVYMYHGFGHNNKKLSRAHGKGISDTDMITRIKVDPLMGGTGMRGNFVKIHIENPAKEVMI
ncbi:molybdopterin-containing oxidoreductase family protein [Lutimonas zeaxanthinifaciens]|uniref:molybdopterin-containing oxidoreductase family protein n=1 Tax=Lutimonas zeaxanthinifaciens TaxID=3060215 RepID=UPI00265C9CC8|nr:molybdopterin-dependent oxidoreductase [Lutimonas sp. YSD2104]WKK65006.1 molybdopterin-dependent oxidoreductase [Lutimonas sp. YSD2104]